MWKRLKNWLWGTEPITPEPKDVVRMEAASQGLYTPRYYSCQDGGCGVCDYCREKDNRRSYHRTDPIIVKAAEQELEEERRRRRRAEEQADFTNALVDIALLDSLTHNNTPNVEVVVEAPTVETPMPDFGGGDSGGGGASDSWSSGDSGGGCDTSSSWDSGSSSCDSGGGDSGSSW